MIGEDIEFQTVLEPELWQVYTDIGQMSQVIINLAVNARDAMPEGGKLTLETANVDLDRDYFRKHAIRDEPESGLYVMLAVTDNGIGMDEETQSKLFVPFFTTKEKWTGTGLGLSTVYGIVKQNKGFVWVYSEPGEGTTVKIYLPRTEGVAAVAPGEVEPAAATGDVGVILLVEDEDQLRKLAVRVLQGTGYHILEADNGEEALKAAGAYEGGIALLLTDVVMPKMGGKQLAEHMKALYPGIKVIFMSGYTNNAIAHHGILDRDVDFLGKPFTPESLIHKVREVMGARGVEK